MSDISIRIDGLLLVMVMLAGAGLFALVAIISTIRTLMTSATRRSWTIVILSAWFTVAHGVALAVAITCFNEFGTPSSGPDWIDWLILPWCAFMVFGLVLLYRNRSGNAQRFPYDPA